MKSKLLPSLIVAVVLLAALASTQPMASKSASPLGPAEPAEETNLLVNPDMELGFYPRPTNHYVANYWFEWWGNYLTIPEYIDGGHKHHNVCYPIPEDGRCHNDETGEYHSSQGYIRWGLPYVAGIYQPVSGVTPCRPYTFEIYNRNDADDYHPKVGIDQTGWQITRMGNSPPENCPPDGQSRCPDPYIAAFPETTVWSAKRDHAAFTWEPISVTVEAISTAISVWTYAAPGLASGPAYSTYWDHGKLVEASFPDDRLPNPTTIETSSFIYNVDATKSGSTLQLTWYTQEPAFSQVRYDYYNTTPLSPTAALSHTLYLPLAITGALPQDHATDLDLTTPQTFHSASIPLQDNRGVAYTLFARRLVGDTCETAIHGPVHFDNP